MDVRKFVSPFGQLVTISGHDPRYGEDYALKAFVPADLPETMLLEPSTYAAVERASMAVARADQAARQLPNAGLLARPAIRREAVSTSALEGTFAALRDVLEADLLDDDDDLTRPSGAVSEVLNFVRAAEQAFAWVRERPITLGMLEDLQGILVRGTRADTSDAGRLRTCVVAIGADQRRLYDARFIPPPPGDLLRDGVTSWVEWINRPSGTPLLVKIAAAHYQFEALHPFNDGNGRIGRLVAILQLIRSEVLSVPIVNLSPWFETRRDEYQDQLLQVSHTGKFDPWIEFFCEAVRHQANEATEKVRRLVEVRDGMRAQLRDVRARGVSIQIADELIGYPMITATRAARRHQVTYQAANQGIARLTDLGILRELTGRKYGRMFVCDPVMAIIES